MVAKGSPRGTLRPPNFFLARICAVHARLHLPFSLFPVSYHSVRVYASHVHNSCEHRCTTRAITESLFPLNTPLPRDRERGFEGRNRRIESPAGVKTGKEGRERESSIAWRALCAAYIHVRGVSRRRRLLSFHFRLKQILYAMKIEDWKVPDEHRDLAG